eukprot:GHVQ01001407.1.p1 GENE.GHVQ01001407.1~~GHVQ01001407.1.p1  ORF type:complete len:153 (+),score=24.08 GHVQ01001407.1:484-942(+)
MFDVVYAAVIAELISFTLAAALDALSETIDIDLGVPLKENPVLVRLKERLYARGETSYGMSSLMHNSVTVVREMNVQWSEQQIGELVVTATRDALAIEFVTPVWAKPPHAQLRTLDAARKFVQVNAVVRVNEILYLTARFVKEGDEWLLKEA